MKKLYKIIVLIVFTSLISCSEDFFDKPIDFDLDKKESKLASTALITQDNQGVLVSYTANPLEEDGDIKIVNNAKITLSSDAGIVAYNPNTVQNIYYPDTPLAFVPNMTYTLEIKAENYQTITSSQVYPEHVEILDASINNEYFTIKISDNGNQKNYYVLKLIEQSSSGEYDRYLEPFGSFSDRSSLCGSCVIFSDETFNGTQNFEIVTKVSSYNTNSTYKAVLYNITEDYYKYDKTFYLNTDNGPFVEPVILHRNFENGYGIFALANKSELVFNP